MLTTQDLEDLTYLDLTRVITGGVIKATQEDRAEAGHGDSPQSSEATERSYFRCPPVCPLHPTPLYPLHRIFPVPTPPTSPT